MPKFLKSEKFFVFFFSALLILIAFIPFFYQVKQTPKDNIFLGVHNNALDYPMFVSEILSSMRGRWTFLAKFTSEPQPGTLVHPIYLPLGKLGALLNLSPVSVYHLGRIIFGFTLSFSYYYFICQVFAKNEKAGLISKRKLAFLLALFSAGFTIIDWNKFPPEITGSYLSWWTGGDVLRRAVFQPHAMLKNTLLLSILVWMGKLLSPSTPSNPSLQEIQNSTALPSLSLRGVPTKSGRRRNLRYLFYSLPSGFLLGLLDPMNTLTILILLGLYWFFCFLKIGPLRLIKPINSIHQSFIHNSLFIILYLLFSLSTLFYTHWVFTHTPWKAVKDWESLQFYQVPFWDYAFHIGPTFFLGTLGIPLLIFRKRNFFTFTTLSLILLPIFFITSGITQRLGLSTLRFFQTPVYFFLAITSAEFISQILILVKKVFSKLFSRKSFLLTFYYSFLFIFYSLLFLPSVPAYLYSLNNQLEEFKVWYWNIYPDKKSYELMLWLKNHTPLDSVVLTNPMVGNILPAVSGNTVYIGHFVSTVNYSQKEILVKKFLEGKMSSSEAKNFLQKGRIDYLLLLWGEQYRIETQKYPFLKKLHFNEMGSIYQFVK